jgi:hypothetical protein
MQFKKEKRWISTFLAVRQERQDAMQEVFVGRKKESGLWSWCRLVCRHDRNQTCGAEFPFPFLWDRLPKSLSGGTRLMLLDLSV